MCGDEERTKAMVWTYRITAAARPRLIMRLAQIFDQQLLEIDRLEVIRERDVTAVRIEIDCDEYLARRIHAKLYRLSDVLHVVLANARDEVVGEGKLPNPNAPSEFDPLTPQP
jgi:glycine cleavage system regulatory protein